MDDPSDSAPEVSAPAMPAAPRRRRFFARTLKAVGAIVLATLLLLCAILGSLDRPTVKRRVQKLVRDEAGLAIDYDATHLRLSGLRIDGLRVASPAPFDAVAPELARVGSVAITWSVGSLRRGALDSVALQDVALTVVQAGQDDSIAALLRERPAAASGPASSSPLSRALLDALPAELPVGRVTVGGITVTLERREPGAIPGKLLERLRLDGLRLGATAKGRGPARTISLALGDDQAPLELHLSREQAAGARGEAQARLRGTVSAREGKVTIHLALELERQSFDRALPAVAHLFTLDGEARFLPKAGRVEVALAKLDAADGALAASGELTVPDRGPAILLRAEGAIDLARALRVVPAGWAPLSLTTGTVRLRASQLALAGIGRAAPLGTTGQLHLDAALDGVRMDDAGVKLALDGGHLVLDAHADGDAHAKVSGTLAIAFSRLAATVPGKAGSRASAERGALSFDGRALALDGAEPLESTGALALTGTIGALSSRAAGLITRARGIGLKLTTHSDGRPPYALSAELPIAAISVTRTRGTALVRESPGKIVVRLSEVVPDAARPIASRLMLHTELALGGLSLVADGSKRADEADFQLAASGRMGLLAALAGPAALGGYALPWAQMTLALRSKGAVRRISSGAPAIAQSSTLALGRPALRGHGQDLAAATLTLALDSDGDARANRGRLTLALRGLRSGGRALGDGKLAGTVAFDLAHPKLSVELTGSGSAGPDGTMALRADFDRAKRAVEYRADLALGRLTLLEPLVSSLLGSHQHLSGTRLALTLHASGEVGGVVLGFRGTQPILARDPLRSARGHDQIDLTVSGLHYTGDDGLMVAVPALTSHTLLEADGKRRTLLSEVAIEKLHAVVGGDRIDAEELAPKLTVALSGDPLAGAGELELHATAKTIRDRNLGFYPLGGVELAAKIERSAEGDVRLSALRFDNAAGGTHLDATGGLDLTTVGNAPAKVAARGTSLSASLRDRLRDRLIAGRRSLSISGTLRQTLDKLSGGAEELSAGGQLGLQFQVQSADLRLFHTSGTLALDGARLALGRSHLALDGVSARLPVTEDLLVDDDGQITRLGGVDVNAYPRLRFSDQHPFLSNESFLAIKRVSAGGVTFGPLAGNARIDRNLLALDQLELYAAGGKVTGQCLVDLAPEGGTITFRGAVTGLRATSGEDDGERLDANAALTLDLGRRDLEGRAELIRVGRHHLLSLLDLYDPYHADVAANRVRSALKIGYPKSVRLRFEQGFASLAISLGGVARLVRIDEIRHVPVGPLIEKYLGPLLAKGAP